MDILKQIAIKNLKLNKKRTISTIIGIVLSCSLICAVATIVTSFQTTLVQNSVNKTGYYHLKLSNITDENIKTLENNRDIKDIWTISQNGYGILENGQNEYKPYLKLYSMDKTSFENLKFKLQEGRFPKNENEIIISQHIIDNGKVNYKIGDKIKIAIGTRETLDHDKLNSSNPYNEEGEQLVGTQDYEFTIVGVMKRPEYSFEDYGDPGYTIITTNLNSSNQDAYVSLKNPRNYKTDIMELLGAENFNEVVKAEGHSVQEMEQKEIEPLNYEFSINDRLLRWEVFAFSNRTVSMLYGVAGVVIFIIIFTSVFCIRNSFAIATTEKMKMYGMLSSIGATKKQIKKSVILESLTLGVIGIPLGILSGIFAVVVLIKIVNSLIGDYLLGNMDGIIVSISILPIALSVVLSMITIYLSAIHSARRASKVTPIEALRSSNDIKIKSKKLKVPKLISKIFKTGGELAYKNLKRSRKKYKTTIVSLAVSIFIFIAMNSFLTNMFDLTDNYYEDYDYNIKIYCSEDNQEEIEKITKLNNIDEYFILYQNANFLRIKDLSKINEIPGIDLEEDSYYNEEQEEYIQTGEGKMSALQILALDNVTFSKYVKKIGLNYEKVKNTGILCDEFLYSENSGKQIETRIYKYSIGDTITGKLGNKEESFKVGAITDIRPYGIEKSYYSGGYFILNLDEYKNIDFEPRTMSIQSSDTEKLEEEMENANIKVDYMNLEASAKEEKAMSLVIKIFLYGFIAVITLIGVTNIFNTITSNMELRQKEFAMLKSIGMTRQEFNRMINLETCFYCVKALIYGILLGLLGTFTMYKAFSVKIEQGVYIPVNPIIISVIAVFILVFIIMKYSMAKINRQNTIETIRNENI